MKRFFSGRRTQSGPPIPEGLEGAFPQQAGLAEMGFLDHLEEMRWAIIKAGIGILLCTIAAFFFRRWIIEVLLLGPKDPGFFMYEVFGIDAVEFVLQNRNITGQFFADIGTVFAVGIIIGSPIAVYQLWKFIEPGLYPGEKKGLRFAAVFATFFFILGISFGYLIITPLALQFFAQYSISPEITNEFDISRYFSMITFWAFGAGVLFELPVVIYFLAKLGIATPNTLRKSRKWALISCLILAAFFTPPDPLSQILVAMPLLLLYEGSIFIAAGVEKRRERELNEALA
ncbi:MAG: twin-arginine translocase subunit TatC [Rhodothermales bacterium]|nr:twin-arginine translocase subunit TatC [Rhodothermales bacterium]MBO6779096.1 twin-arginine translocase subunit TatC [Rhodothermales bacterium]